MAVNSRFSDVRGCIEELSVDKHPSIFGSSPYHDSLVDEISVEPVSPNLNFPTSHGVGAGSVPPGVNGGKSLIPGDGNHSSEAALKYINQILMEEEDMEEIPWFLSDQDALQNTEKSLYSALGAEYPGLPGQTLDVDVACSVECLNGKDRVGCVDGTTSVDSSNSVDPNHDPGLPDASYSGGETIRSGDNCSPSETTELSVRNIFSDINSVEQFRRGLEEASKFLPNNTQIFKSIDNMNFVHGDGSSVSDAYAYASKALRTHTRDEKWMEEGRAMKQTAVSTDEVELTEMFDRVLLYPLQETSSSDDTFKETDSIKSFQSQGRRQRGGKSHVKKQNNRKNAVDLRALLVVCAQAVSDHDWRTANELLKQIRENSSPLGDGSQRLAYYFANALEARMAGNGGQMASFFTSPIFKKTSAIDMLKAVHTHLTACPFLKFSIYFGGYMVNMRAANAKVLHIIDFGIGFGFHWPILIQKLSERHGGPPRLRMTGIEFPVPGFRPAQRMEETFRRLDKYCQRFGVPFEYAAIPSADWSSIRIEDLKLRSNEMIAVCSIDRLKNLLDETVEEDNSPRDTVLDLIRSIKPDLFVHSTSAGSYTAPFFVTRFRELLFHLSGLFDMFDATLTGDFNKREVIERELLGREIMNVVACEGAERIERPETHRQWQARLLRAGFESIPVDEELLRGMKSMIRALYHKDFVLDVDRNWLLLGWRGRIMTCCSCWVPN